MLIFQLCGLAFTASDTVFAWIGGSWQEGPLFWAFGLFALIYLIAALYFLVALGFLDGTRGSNRFGPSPKHSANYRAPAIDAAD